MSTNSNEHLLTKKDLHRFFWQSQAFVSGFNYTKEEAPAEADTRMFVPTVLTAND